MTQAPVVKVVFELPVDSWHGYATESLWAEDLGHGSYRIRNSPFYAKGVSNGDVIAAGSGPNEPLVFGRVLIRSGHSTYRIIVKEEASGGKFEEYWSQLRSIGCTYEGGPRGLFAIDIQPHVNIFEAYRALEEGEANGAWEFEEGHCGHVTSARPSK